MSTEQSNADISDKINRLAKWAGAGAILLTALTGAIGVWLDNKVGNVDAELKSVVAQREFDLKLYEVTKSALTSQKISEQLVAIALICSIGREPLRDELLQAFYDAPDSLVTDPEISTEARVCGARAKRRASGELIVAEARRPLPPPPSPAKPSPESSPKSVPGDKKAKASPVNWGMWDIDLFYCVPWKKGGQKTESATAQKAIGAATATAQAIMAAGAKGRIRVRPITSDVNARPGYSINGYAIRRNNTAAEIEMSKNLQRVMQKQVGKDSKITLQPTAQNTPWYLSGFFCPQ